VDARARVDRVVLARRARASIRGVAIARDVVDIATVARASVVAE
jgi:hypothetical protein